MKRLFDALRRHAQAMPDKIALVNADRVISYAQLLAEVEAFAAYLQSISARSVAIATDNGPAWVIADLAAMLAGVPCIPIPLFFSASQVRHVLTSAEVDTVLVDSAAWDSQVRECGYARIGDVAPGLTVFRSESARGGAIPAGIVKVTFTSGTTGDPKGVCLDGETIGNVASSLADACQATPDDRHLCLLPLSTLLENIGGIYVPLLAGASLGVPSLHEVGLTGSSGLDVARLVDSLGRWQATTAIMVPQMLQVLVAAGRAGLPVKHVLRYLAVGGAAVSPALVEAANTFGLPVFEGYGLSECASVVAVNTPDAARRGSVGRPLPHVKISFAADGEILVEGNRWNGYLGQATGNGDNEAIATGDLGYLDDEGFLHIAGRKKNVFITSFGRNVAPEWVESEVLGQHGIAQAAVFGDGQPFNCAVVVPMPGAGEGAVMEAVAAANRALPDYARVHAWVLAREPFSVRNGMATANGRLRRSAIGDAYAAQIADLYQSTTRQ